MSIKSPTGAYITFWTWLVAITAVVLVVYPEVYGLLWRTLVGLANITGAEYSFRSTWLREPLEILIGVLVWWRVVKVVVLHGSPFPFYLTISSGRQDSNGKGGRPSVSVWIGDNNAYVNDYKGRFLYGAVFRSHPSSDKLVRARLELLILTLPFGLTLSFHESRLFMRKRDHKGRAQQYRLVADKYSSTNETTRPDKFRTELLRHAKTLAESFDKGKRIDGLNWRFFYGGGGMIMDDFGFHVSFEQAEGNTFKVTRLGPKSDGETTVDSVEALRELAKAELHPVG